VSAVPALLADGRGRRLAVVALWAVAQGAAAAVGALALRATFAALHDDGPVPAAAIAALALAGLAMAAARVMERTAAEALGYAYAQALRRRLLGRLARQSARAVARKRAGHLSLRFVGDLSTARHWLARGLARLVAAAVLAPLALGALAVWDWRLALAAGLPLAGGAAATALVARRLGPAQERLRAARARIAAEMAERAPLAPQLRLTGRLGREQAAQDGRAAALEHAATLHGRAAALARACADAAWGLAAAALVGAAAALDAAPADLAMALALTGLLLRPLRDLAGVADRRAAWTVARERLETILTAPRLGAGAAQDAPRPAGRPGPAAALSLSALGGPGVAGVTLYVPAGARVALVGPVGAGKSALLALIAGLEAPTEGAARVDGADPLALGAAARARTIAHLGPRAPILRGSLRRALTLGLRRRPADAAIEAAARRFGLGGALDRLGGLDGRVEEGGRNLSDGERRGAILVRAALSRARLLLLDDPTEGLSPDQRAAAIALIATAPGTVVMATHDAALAAQADVAAVLYAGRLVAAGPPADAPPGPEGRMPPRAA
jgi:ABC-type transport system involved in cytochrome bd biosynthesis fused ATPase/permease subunit